VEFIDDGPQKPILIWDRPVIVRVPPAFHLLANPTGPICNLDCEYCCFLSKEMLYPGETGVMAAKANTEESLTLLRRDESLPKGTRTLVSAQLADRCGEQCRADSEEGSGDDVGGPVLVEDVPRQPHCTCHDRTRDPGGPTA